MPCKWRISLSNQSAKLIISPLPHPQVRPCLSQLGTCRYCGVVCLAPASLAAADGSPFILPQIGLFIGARETERRGALAKPRWSRHTAALAPVVIHSPGPDQSRHTAYGGDRCFRGDAGEKKKKHLRRVPVWPPRPPAHLLTTLWLTFKNHPWDTLAPRCRSRASRRRRSKRCLANALENMGKQSW